MRNLVGLLAALCLPALAAPAALAFGHHHATRAPRVQNTIVVGGAPGGGCCGRAPQATIVQRSYVPVQHSYCRQQSFVSAQRSFVPVQRSYAQVQQDFVPVERTIMQRSYVPVERTIMQRDYVPAQTIVQQDYAQEATATCAPAAGLAPAPSYDYSAPGCAAPAASFSPGYAPGYGAGAGRGRGVIRHRERTVQRGSL